jgi:hypothetical protein
MHKKNNSKSRKTDPDKLYNGTSLNGAMGELVCVGWALDDRPAQSLYRDSLAPGTEKLLLEAVVSEWSENLKNAASPVWIGHNIRDFDLRFIMQRAMVLGVPWPFPVNFRTHVYDTMQEWAGWGKMVSMEEVGMAFGIPMKQNGLSGDKVWGAILQGRYKDVADYCCCDVEDVRKIFNIMTGREKSPRAMQLHDVSSSSSIQRAGAPARSPLEPQNKSSAEINF